MDDSFTPQGMEPPEPAVKRRADAMARADVAWRARIAGATWQTAAEVAGYANGENAARGVRQTYGTLPEVDRVDLRRLWRERLEALWQQVYRDALDRQPGSVTAAVRVAQAAAKLDGLDAPAEIVVHDPTRRELEDWVARVLRGTTPEFEEGDIIGGDLDQT